jgi:hypothetical protein
MRFISLSIRFRGSSMRLKNLIHEPFWFICKVQKVIDKAQRLIHEVQKLIEKAKNIEFESKKLLTFKKGFFMEIFQQSEFNRVSRFLPK